LKPAAKKTSKTTLKTAAKTAAKSTAKSRAGSRARSRAKPAGAAPNTVLGLDHLVLRVKDLAASIAFYRRVFGARIERQLQTPRIVQLRIGDSLLDLVPGGRGPARPRRAGPAPGPLRHRARGAGTALRGRGLRALDLFS
jgi:hypothetical protein